MKKIICLTLAFIMTFSVVAFAEMEYPTDEKNGVVSVYLPFQTRETGKVAFPNKTTEGKDITKIGDFACFECFGVTEVEIPGGITTIGRSAFTSIFIKSIVIPEGVTKIENRAFALCPKLESISFPSTLKYVDSFAFYRTKWLDNQPNGFVTVGDNVLLTYKGNEAEIAIPDGTKSIAGACFYGNLNVNKITVPESVEWIGDYAFKYCNNLTLLVKEGSIAKAYAEKNKIPYQIY